MVVLGEDPGIEIRGDVGSDVHLGQIFVVAHLFLRDLDPLLEGDGNVVITGIHGLGDPGVRAVGANDQIDLERLGFSSGPTSAVIGVMKGVGTFAICPCIDFLNQSVDQGCAEIGGTVAEKGVEHLATAHPDVGVVVVTEGVKTNIHLPIGGRNHFHVSHLSVDDVVR